MSSGSMLRELRGDKTIRQVAEELGISASALAMYENGHRTPRDEVKVRISKYYARTVQDIFFAENEH